MSSDLDRLVDDYLDRLDSALADLPRGRRREVVEEIAEHIAAARAEAAVQSQAELRTVLDRIGDPEEIAAAALDRPPARRTWVEVGALVLLLVGGVVLPVVGWLAGVVLLWISTVWTTREKVIGTLVVPGGLGLALFVGLGVAVTATSARSCAEPATRTGAAVTYEIANCTGGPSGAAHAAVILGVVTLLALPVATTIFLTRRLHARTV